LVSCPTLLNSNHKLPLSCEKEEIKLLGDALWVQEMKGYARATRGKTRSYFDCLSFLNTQKRKITNVPKASEDDATTFNILC
jgi:hypothetical protein